MNLTPLSSVCWNILNHMFTYDLIMVLVEAELCSAVQHTEPPAVLPSQEGKGELGFVWKQNCERKHTEQYRKENSKINNSDYWVTHHLPNSHCQKSKTKNKYVYVVKHSVNQLSTAKLHVRSPQHQVLN